MKFSTVVVNFYFIVRRSKLADDFIYLKQFTQEVEKGVINLQVRTHQQKIVHLAIRSPKSIDTKEMVFAADSETLKTSHMR